MSLNMDIAAEIAPALRMMYMMRHVGGSAFAAFSENEPKAEQDSKTLNIEMESDFEKAFEAYVNENGKPPEIVGVNGLGYFKLFESFGVGTPKGRLNGKIAIVTGSAQGFGKGIARALAAEGAHVAVADLNYEGAVKCAEELNTDFHGSAIAVKADVSSEQSVKDMVNAAVLAFGGLDIMVSNAGILFAGGLPEMSLEKFELVTKVNYTGYFLCAKYASVPMKIQRRCNPEYTADIIEINSKSGLEGSNKNFAYAGGKFGGIGLTQSFALELVEHGIKVNAICPGNMLDGPLWSDPVKGLFKQYLDAGKVPGAKTVADVREFYEDKVPMKRGCTPEDVALAIFYAVEQQYETGQAIPVTGGQIMLK